MKKMSGLIYFLFSLFTAVIGYNVNNKSVFWAIVDLIFPIFAWIKWVICQEVNITIIKNSFTWFFK